MKCEYCAAKYLNDTYEEFCSKTCTNKADKKFERNGFVMVQHEKFDIGQNINGYHIFSKQDDRPTIGSFNTSAEAVDFAKERGINGGH